MSDWPAPSSAVPEPTGRQRTPKGCMGALPQIFQWSRVLSSNNKCIATSADVQTPSAATQKQTEIKRWTKQVQKPVVLQHRVDGLEQLGATVSHESAIRNSSAWKVSDSSVSREIVGMDLWQVLHAKQEPFVLQDVIREKRQPMRIPSSRELKFEAPPTRRSVKIKTSTTSKYQEQAAEDEGSAACRSQYCEASRLIPTASAAVARRSRVPVESMVAMPSHQAPGVCGVNSATKSHSKAASLGRNPVKSPNKRALLMEAAARILEGSNRRRTSKRPSISVRSLSEDLEKSKNVNKLSQPKEKLVKELSKPKEKLVRAVAALHSESLEREEVLSSNGTVILGERATESKQHQNSYDLKFFGKHNTNSSCKHHFEISQIVKEDLFVMQTRVCPYDNALDEAEVLPSLATPVQNSGPENKGEHVQLHDDLWSGMQGIQRNLKFNSSKVLLEAKMEAVALDVLPEVFGMKNQYPELDYDAVLKDSRAIVPSTSVDSAANFLPVMLMSSCLPILDCGMPSLMRSVLDYSLARQCIWGYQAAAAFPVNSSENTEGSNGRRTGRGLIEGADKAGYAYRLRDKFAELERQNSVMQLRLCNYSWWTSGQNISPENQLSTEYSTGYDSPVAARCSYFEKVWNEEMSEAAASGYVYPMDHFQQASPVSVLEPVEDEELELANSFDNFEEARQKLMEKVRQYEMLAHMDVDMLKKVSEEHVSHAWDDNESWETDYSYSSSSSGGTSDSSFQASPAHDNSSRDLEAHDSSCNRLSYAFFPEDQSLYGHEVEMRPSRSLDCLTEKLEPRPIGCRVLQPQRSVSGDDHIKEVVGKPSCNSRQSIVDYVVKSLLDEDLAMSNWSSSKQEEEVVEQELESCFFEVLMCELLSDLLKAQLKPFCNALELGNPLQNAELIS